LQLDVIGQAASHAPQFALSMRVSTQTPLHEVSFAGHAHVPAVHVDPGAQATPHAPQLCGSDPRSAQAAAQLTSGAGQPAVHADPAQT
jgi:predicted PhzF superfamily epimerase YddE/YHI9